MKPSSILARVRRLAIALPRLVPARVGRRSAPCEEAG